MKKPKPYVVYTSGTDEYLKNYFLRVGPANSVEEAMALIESEKKGLGETFGGLIEPATKGKNRRYHIFKANWEEIK